MKRSCFALAILLVGLFLMPATAHMASDPISGSMDISPSKLTSPGTIRVVINIMNTNDDDQIIPVTLLDPAGNVCSTFGSGGTANLGPNAANAYTGNWLVTQQQLESGRITYTARYTFVDENGIKTTTQSLISKAIQHNKVEAKLHVERVIEPGSKVQQGTTVTIRYKIKNIGTVDVTNIKITDPGVISEPVTYPSLAVDETADVFYTLTAGAEPITTYADVSFDFLIDDKTETSTMKVDTAGTIEVLVPDLLIQLTGQQIVNKGDKVDLTYVITNKSDLTYEQIKITDELLQDIESNLSIKPQQTYTGTHSITVNENATYQFTLVGVDSTGQNVIFQSNQLTIQTTEAVQDVTTLEVVPVVLNIEIEADRTVVYEEPSDIIFRIKVTNNGTTAVENVAIKAVNTTIRTIDRIEPNQTIDFVKALSASVGGQFQFTATAKDNTGAEQKFESQIVTVPYEFIPTPEPPPTPEPTVPPTEAPLTDPTTDPNELPFGSPEEAGPGIGTILLYVLAGLFGLVFVAVAVLFFLDGRRGGARKGGGSAKVIDSIERVPHRDYARAPTATSKRGLAPGRKDKAQPQDAPMEDEPEEGAEADAPPRRQPAASGRGAPPDDDMEGGEQPEDAAEEEYRRAYAPPRRAETPDESTPDVTAYMPPARREAMKQTQAPVAEQLPTEETGDDVPVYRSEYLSRVREEMPDNTPEPEAPAAVAQEDIEATRPIPRAESARRSRDAEEEALLSGSTGQYRLSRRSASVRTEAAETPSRSRATRPDAEDPEAYARRQRAARANKADIARFYDDEDEEETTKPPRRRR